MVLVELTPVYLVFENFRGLLLVNRRWHLVLLSLRSTACSDWLGICLLSGFVLVWVNFVLKLSLVQLVVHWISGVISHVLQMPAVVLHLNSLRLREIDGLLPHTLRQASWLSSVMVWVDYWVVIFVHLSRSILLEFSGATRFSRRDGLGGWFHLLLPGVT